MTVRILRGDCRDVLRTLPADSVHCCVTSPPYFRLRDYLPSDHPDKEREIGLEQTPAEFVAAMVDVFREVRRVLRPDGVCWVNLGDSYVGGGRGGNGAAITGRGKDASCATRVPFRSGELADKQLLGMPWRVALALQDDGWYLRRDVIWEKPACMPEAVTDRPTTSHEYVFMLTKRGTYFYDAEAIAEPTTGNAHHRGHGVHPKATHNAAGARQNASYAAAVNDLVATRNVRSVWRIPVEPCPEAHFATMAPGLAERCILAGTSEAGCCPHCGAPWERIIEKGEADAAAQRACGADASGGYSGQSTKGHNAAGVQNASDVKRRILEGMRVKRTVGWRPTCQCPEHKPISCTVLDPFGGAGTTGLVADRLGRDAILIELHPDYPAMAERRIRKEAGMFAKVAAE